MYCDRCGTNLPAQARFCSNCGRAFEPTALTPQRGRIAGHIRLLGILWLALAAFRLIPGIIFIAIAGSGIMPPDVPGFVRAIFPALGALFLCGAALGIITGWGLISRQPWARMLAIIFGAVNLVDLPFGTALGIYTLWVLLPAESEAEYMGNLLNSRPLQRS